MLPLHLQTESHIPLYVQLRDQLRALVHSGELRFGDRIPASRELAGQLGVHRTTIANAYAELESEGLIEGHVGRGTFICGGRVKQFSPPPRSNGDGGAMRWEALFADERGEEGLSRMMPVVPPGAIGFTSARPSDELFPVEEFRRCCNAVLRAEGRRILQLGSTDGYEPLKRVVLSMLRDEGLNVSSEQLLITDGCQQAIDLVCKAFLRPGDAVALENPAYPGAIAIFSGARVRTLAVAVETDRARTGHVGLDIDALETVLMQNRVKFIFVTPDFHNPTGTALPVAERRRLLEIAARYQVAVIEDGIYTRIRLRGSAAPSLKALDRSGNVIRIDSFSKIAFPGLRVGWCIAPESVIERLRLVKQSADLHTDQLAQATLAEFIRRGCLARHVAKTMKVYRSRLAAMEEALEKHMPEQTTWTRPEGGMSIWVSLPPGFDAAEFLIHCREHGVLFVPGRYFYLQHPQPNTLRLGFASEDEKRIARGVETLGGLLKLEFRKRQRGARSELHARVALI
ncbi:MAG TPA: PLP-dependent aminotransferase family protein [Verrucomicrobiae bacterium]|jgi:2-aminoadipate transaminase|nr:PLP-dependent aminotransferase family protein [Verrucomicrobiae bacterium]